MKKHPTPHPPSASSHQNRVRDINLIEQDFASIEHRRKILEERQAASNLSLLFAKKRKQIDDLNLDDGDIIRDKFEVLQIAQQHAQRASKYNPPSSSNKGNIMSNTDPSSLFDMNNNNMNNQSSNLNKRKLVAQLIHQQPHSSSSRPQSALSMNSDSRNSPVPGQQGGAGGRSGGSSSSWNNNNNAKRVIHHSHLCKKKNYINLEEYHNNQHLQQQRNRFASRVSISAASSNPLNQMSGTFSGASSMVLDQTTTSLKSNKLQQQQQRRESSMTATSMNNLGPSASAQFNPSYDNRRASTATTNTNTTTMMMLNKSGSIAGLPQQQPASSTTNTMMGNPYETNEVVMIRHRMPETIKNGASSPPCNVWVDEIVGEDDDRCDGSVSVTPTSGEKRKSPQTHHSRRRSTSPFDYSMSEQPTLDPTLLASAANHQNINNIHENTNTNIFGEDESENNTNNTNSDRGLASRPPTSSTNRNSPIPGTSPSTDEQQQKQQNQLVVVSPSSPSSIIEVDKDPTEHLKPLLSQSETTRLTTKYVSALAQKLLALSEEEQSNKNFYQRNNKNQHTTSDDDSSSLSNNKQMSQQEFGVMLFGASAVQSAMDAFSQNNNNNNNQSASFISSAGATNDVLQDPLSPRRQFPGGTATAFHEHLRATNMTNVQADNNSNTDSPSFGASGHQISIFDIEAFLAQDEEEEEKRIKRHEKEAEEKQLLELKKQAASLAGKELTDAQARVLLKQSLAGSQSRFITKLPPRRFLIEKHRDGANEDDNYSYSSLNHHQLSQSSPSPIYGEKTSNNDLFGMTIAGGSTSIKIQLPSRLIAEESNSINNQNISTILSSSMMSPRSILKQTSQIDQKKQHQQRKSSIQSTSSTGSSNSRSQPRADEAERLVPFQRTTTTGSSETPIFTLKSDDQQQQQIAGTKALTQSVSFPAFDNNNNNHGGFGEAGRETPRGGRKSISPAALFNQRGGNRSSSRESSRSNPENNSPQQFGENNSKKNKTPMMYAQGFRQSSFARLPINGNDDQSNRTPTKSQLGGYSSSSSSLRRGSPQNNNTNFKPKISKEIHYAIVEGSRERQRREDEQHRLRKAIEEAKYYARQDEKRLEKETMSRMQAISSEQHDHHDENTNNNNSQTLFLHKHSSAFNSSATNACRADQEPPEWLFKAKYRSIRHSKEVVENYHHKNKNRQLLSSSPTSSIKINPEDYYLCVKLIMTRFASTNLANWVFNCEIRQQEFQDDEQTADRKVVFAGLQLDSDNYLIFNNINKTTRLSPKQNTSIEDDKKNNLKEKNSKKKNKTRKGRIFSPLEDLPWLQEEMEEDDNQHQRRQSISLTGNQLRIIVQAVYPIRDVVLDNIVQF